MSSAIIICPDRFVQATFAPVDFLPPKMGRPPAGRARVRPRRHLHKQAQMCRNCLFGHDGICQSESCTCVCRENEPRFVAAKAAPKETRLEEQLGELEELAKS